MVSFTNHAMTVQQLYTILLGDASCQRPHFPFSFELSEFTLSCSLLVSRSWTWKRYLDRALVIVGAFWVWCLVNFDRYMDSWWVWCSVHLSLVRMGSRILFPETAPMAQHHHDMPELMWLCRTCLSVLAADFFSLSLKIPTHLKFRA